MGPPRITIQLVDIPSVTPFTLVINSGSSLFVLTNAKCISPDVLAILEASKEAGAGSEGDVIYIEVGEVPLFCSCFCFRCCLPCLRFTTTSDKISVELGWLRLFFFDRESNI